MTTLPNGGVVKRKRTEGMGMPRWGTACRQEVFSPYSALTRASYTP